MKLRAAPGASRNYRRESWRSSVIISAPVNRGRTNMRLEGHFESSSTLQRNERVKLAASFWNNIGAGMVIGGVAAAFFLDKPQGTWTKIGIAIEIGRASCRERM